MLIVSKVNKDDLINVIYENYNDKAKAKFAIKLGDGGDLTYELHLLYETIKIIKKTYPRHDSSDKDMTELKQKLNECIPILNNMLD